MQRLEVSVAVRPIYGSLGFKRLTRRLKGQNNTQRNIYIYIYIRETAYLINRSANLSNWRLQRIPLSANTKQGN